MTSPSQPPDALVRVETQVGVLDIGRLWWLWVFAGVLWIVEAFATREMNDLW
jgi:hypothetical protein